MPNEENISTLASNIKKGIDTKLKDLHTSMPGIVQSFNASLQTVTVQPAIKRIFKSQEEDTEILTPADLPVLINVPVAFPKSGGYSMTIPISPGDECLLQFCERSIDNWHVSGIVSLPGARRFHSLSDAVAIMGLSSIPNKIGAYSTTDLQIRKDDGSSAISLKPDSSIKVENNNGSSELFADGRFKIENSNGSAELFTDGKFRIENSNGYIELQSDGQFNVNGVVFDIHYHDQPDDSDGNTEMPTGAPQS